jgi:hypothetical protein
MKERQQLRLEMQDRLLGGIWVNGDKGDHGQGGLG